MSATQGYLVIGWVLSAQHPPAHEEETAPSVALLISIPLDNSQLDDYLLYGSQDPFSRLGPNAARADKLHFEEALNRIHGSCQPCPTQLALQKAHQLGGKSTPQEPGLSFPCAEAVTSLPTVTPLPKTAACASA